MSPAGLICAESFPRLRSCVLGEVTLYLSVGFCDIQDPLSFIRQTEVLPELISSVMYQCQPAEQAPSGGS